MDELRKHLRKWEFSLNFDPRGNGDCFYGAAAWQLGITSDSAEDMVSNHLSKNRYDVSTFLCKNSA